MNLRLLHADNYWLLGGFASQEPREPWVREAEDFLTQIAPTGMGDAQGSLIVMISVDDGSDIAAAVFRPHPKYCATHLQCFVVRPELRGQKFAVPALAEVCDNLLSEDGAPQYVTWAVREGNAPMLRVSSSVGDQITTGEELVHFVHP